MKVAFVLALVPAVIGIFWACSRKPSTPSTEISLSGAERVRFMQYLSEGRRLYSLYCSNCHQPDGSGLKRLYPALRGSDFLKTREEATICGIRYGMEGNIGEDGVMYPQVMPANPSLSDLEIAELATFVYYEFAGEVSTWTPQVVRRILSDCEEKL